MNEILVVGDVHGDLSFASAICRTAKAFGISDIIQVGDFGVWDHTEEGVYFLDKLDENSELRGVNWTFVAGNHENYDSLEDRQALGADDSGFVELRKNIRWTGRTNVWDYKGYRFAAFGGAYSIDKADRKPGSSWWWQEMPTLADLYNFEGQVGGDHVDILFTHDSTTSLPEWPGFFKADVDSAASRNIITSAYWISKPALAFHGHYHRELEYAHEQAKVYGLGCNYDAQRYYGMPKQAAAAIVRLDDMSVKFINYVL
jgi:hypothetical protein